MAGENDKKKEKKTFRQKSSTAIRSCCHFMYNREEKTVMGRTGISWLQILSFYFCFYAVIAGIWAICMACFLATLDPYAPTQVKMYSMLKNNPGMGFWPTSDNSSTLVNFETTNSTSYQFALNALNNVVSLYNESNELFPNCGQATNTTANLSVACYFNPALLGNSCVASNHYGYSEGKPCVLLRINKIYGWDPRPLFDGGNSPNEQEFYKIPDKFKTKYINSSDNNYIPISCEPENDIDADNVKSITFYPEYGIPAYYFPYFNQPKYQPPAVMAQIEANPGVLVMLWCKFWTKNVIFDRNDLQGSVHFEVYTMNNFT